LHKEAILNPEKKIAMADKPLAEISPAAAKMLSWGWEAADSLEVFNAIRDETIESADFWYSLGRSLYGESHLSESLACFERVAGLSTDPIIAFAACRLLVQAWKASLWQRIL